MKAFYLLAAVAALSLPFAAPAVMKSEADPEVVPAVDVNRYLGLWYEIGHFPNFFQRDCVRSMAEYGARDDGRVSVRNSCDRADGSRGMIEGSAFAPNPAEPTKLKVDFGFSFLGDYWIIDLDADYQWAVVSGPAKQSLFILSRQAPMDAATLDGIISRLNSRGFDTGKIIYDQWPGPADL